MAYIKICVFLCGLYTNIQITTLPHADSQPIDYGKTTMTEGSSIAVGMSILAYSGQNVNHALYLLPSLPALLIFTVYDACTPNMMYHESLPCIKGIQKHQFNKFSYL